MSPGEWASIEVTGEDLSEDDRILLVTSWEIRGVVALYGSRGKFLCRDRSLMGIQVAACCSALYACSQLCFDLSTAQGRPRRHVRTVGASARAAEHRFPAPH